MLKSGQKTKQQVKKDTVFLGVKVYQSDTTQSVFLGTPLVDEPPGVNCRLVATGLFTRFV